LDNIVERAIERAKRRGASAEVCLSERLRSEVAFEAGNLKTAERKRRLGIGLRVISEGRMGFAAASDESRIDDLVESALASARFGKEAGFAFPGRAAHAAYDAFDPGVERYGPEEAILEGMKAVDFLKGECPNGLTDVNISASVADTRIVNTSGLDVSWRSTEFHHAVTLVVVEGDSILWIGEGGSYGTLDLRTDDYVRSIADLERKSREKAPKLSGALPVLFVAHEMPNLLASIELGVNGRRFVKGESPLIGREGESILGGITIADDPLLPGAPGGRPFDDEGSPSRKNLLFEDGVFRSFLFDMDTAAQAGRATTASAVRGPLSPPTVGTSNLVVSTGDSDLGRMIAQIKEGVIVYGVLGGGQSNLLAGDFALNVMLGFHIRGGEIGGRLTDTMVSGNVYGALGSAAARGKVARPVGPVFTPDILFSELSVSGR
jgi:PmbA protein